MSGAFRPVPWRQKFLQTKIVTLFGPLFDFAPPWIFGIVTYAETQNFVNLTQSGRETQDVLCSCLDDVGAAQGGGSLVAGGVGLALWRMAACQ